MGTLKLFFQVLVFGSELTGFMIIKLWIFECVLLAEIKGHSDIFTKDLPRKLLRKTIIDFIYLLK